MKKLGIGIGMAIALAAIPASAASAQRGWVPPSCELSTGHYLVNSALLYLQTAAGSRFADQRERHLRDANRVLHQALEQGREDDPAVWYFLGRYYAATDDPAGADTAWDKAELLQPDCHDDITELRRRIWVPILNGGVEALQGGDYAAAVERFSRANRIYDQEPLGFYYVAQAHQALGQYDSAVVSYRRAIRVAQLERNRDNEQYAEVPERSSYNIAVLFQNQQAHDSAVAWFARYRVLNPDDYQAMTSQASALAAAGRDVEAVALYDSVLMAAEHMPAFQLFETGAALFRAGRLARAAQAFERGLEQNPHYRDALYNLANTYFRLSEEDSSMKPQVALKMNPVARRLVRIDPASQASARILAASFLIQGAEDSTVAALERAQNMKYDLTVSVFRELPNGGYEVRGLITNQSEAAVTLPTITFEFVNTEGEVLETAQIPGQAVDPAGGVPFALQPATEGIAAWRYTLGT